MAEGGEAVRVAAGAAGVERGDIVEQDEEVRLRGARRRSAIEIAPATL